MLRLLIALLLCSILPVNHAAAALLELQNRTIDTTLDHGLELRESLPAGPYIIQLAEIPTGAEKERLSAAGIQLRHYLPSCFWLAEVGVLKAPEQLHDLISWIDELLPEDRLASRILQHQLPEDSFTAAGDLQVIVRPFSREQEFVESIQKMAREYNWSVGRISDRFARLNLTLPLADIPVLAAAPQVRWIEPLPPRKKQHNDGVRINMQVDPLQEPFYNLRGSGMAVGVWDGGTVTAQHPDFDGRLTIEDPQDTDSHATHVAGTMAGDGGNSDNNNGSPYQWRGVATDADIHSWDWDDAEEEYADAAEQLGLMVSNNSWGYGIESGWCDFYGDYAAFCVDADLVVPAWQVNIQFSAGNERGWNECGQGANSYANIPPPATAKNIICVGAINSNNSTMTSFSSWGPVDDGRIKPDLCAPGCESGNGYIKSTLPPMSYGGPGWCGTSMASPAASGVVTLLQQAYRARFDDAPYPSLIKGLLIQTAEDLGNEGPDYSYGWGVIDALAAVEHFYRGNYLQEMIFGEQVYTHTFTVADGTDDLRVTLVWDDPPGTENAQRTLISDLDLRLTAPDATGYLPWVTNPANPSQAAGTGNDSLNNVEQVFVADPQAGEWTITIDGDLPYGYQLFSLILPHNEDRISLSHQPVDTLFQEATGSRVECTITGSGEVNLTESAVCWTDSWGSNGEVALQSAGGNQYFGMIPVTVTGPIDYYLRAVDLTGDQDLFPPGAPQGICSTFISSSEYVSRAAAVPREFALLPLYPNPFNPATTCAFSLREAGQTQLIVYDLTGRRVKQLLDRYLEAGVYETTFQAGELAAGLYFIELHQGERRQTRKALLVK